jgi:pimeloyl-ACP methyl ester carboxylesterase
MSNVQGIRSSVVIGVLILTGAACTNSTSTTPTTSVAAAPTTSAVAVVFDGAVPVDGGRVLLAQCVGHGTPTVLLEGGGIDPSLDDYPPELMSAIGEHTTVCRYSRAGGGGSTPAPRPRTMASILADVDQLLSGLHDKAGVNGPYVFAGTSFGGEVALGEALEHPTETAGLVILDTDFPTPFMPTCLKSGRTQADCQADYDGDSEAKNMDSEVIPLIHGFPALPIQLVTAMIPSGCSIAPGASSVSAGISGANLTAPNCTSLFVKIADLQIAGWRTLNPQVVQTRVQADHDHLITEAITQVEQAILDAVAK